MIAPPPVAVIFCAVTPGADSRQAGGIEVAFVNTGTTVLHHVTFDIGYHTIDADIARTVTDTGTFSPGVRIEHHLDAFAGISFLGSATSNCIASEAD